MITLRAGRLTPDDNVDVATKILIMPCLNEFSTMSRSSKVRPVFEIKKTLFTTKMLLHNNVEVTGGIKSNTELPITEFYSVDILSKVLVWEKQL